jgi:hypothetical protein
MSEAVASATVPATVLKKTITVASLLAVGKAAGVISVEVAALTQGVLKAMLLTKLKSTTVALCLVFVLTGLGAGLVAHRSMAAAPDDGVNHSNVADRTVVPNDPIQQKRVYQIGDDELSRMLRDPGTRFDVAVVGRTEGTCSGTDLYFYDSQIDVAAVHAGLINKGEKAIITVTVVKCPRSEPGSTRNGVKSAPWDEAKVTDTAFILQNPPATRGEKAVTEPKADKVPARDQPKIDVIGAGETAMELLKSTKDSDAKWMAIRILGNLQYDRAIPQLLESLTDPHEYVRSNSARALGDMRVAAAAKPLTDLLDKEENGGVIQQTSLALANLKCVDALPALKKAAKHKDVQTRMWVLQAIGRLGDKRDVAFLAAYLDDTSQSVQAMAAQAIEQITGADFGFPKRSGPSSPDEGIRRAKAWWAEHHGEYERK